MKKINPEIHNNGALGDKNTKIVKIVNLCLFPFYEIEIHSPFLSNTLGTTYYKYQKKN